MTICRLTAPRPAVYALVVPGLVSAVFLALHGYEATYGSALLLMLPLALSLLPRRRTPETLIILGNSELGQTLCRELRDSAPGDPDPHVLGIGPDISGHEVDRRDLDEIVQRNDISRIVVAEPHMSEELIEFLIDCKLRGVVVEQVADSLEKLSHKIWLGSFRPELLAYSEEFKISRVYLRLKHAMDIVCALLLIILTAPVLTLVAIAIKLTSPGPLLFRQERVGLNGRTFQLLKFRSMRVDAEDGTGPVWAKDDDDRVTPLGGFLRKYRLDEIPQAFNVLRGDMSFIGPRPERPYFVHLLGRRIKYYGLRHHVKPGITGWAQVCHPYGSSIQDAYEKLQYDLYYIKHMSLWVDLKIFVKTIRVVGFGKGR